jgi:hypothetical protein
MCASEHDHDILMNIMITLIYLRIKVFLRCYSHHDDDPFFSELNTQLTVDNMNFFLHVLFSSYPETNEKFAKFFILFLIVFVVVYAMR